MADAPARELSLLGGWRLEVDGRRLEPPPATQRLLALLALRGTHTRAQAAEVLFPGSRNGGAAARLRDLLSRSARGRGPLTEVFADGPQLALTGGVSVDVDRLSAVTAAVRAGRIEALSLLGWRLELLPGWGQPWVAEERDRLRRIVSQALKECSERCLRRADVPGAVLAAERAVALDPLDEAAARWLIRAHLAGGDPAPALQRFDALRSALAADLGVEPDPATLQLVRSHLPRQGVISPAR